MARLLTSGASIAAPVRSEPDLRDTLAELCPNAVFSGPEIHEVYSILGQIHGSWSAEQSRLEIGPIDGKLIGIGVSLDKIVATLEAHQTGLHERQDVEIVSRLISILSIDPELGAGQSVDRFVANFKQEAAKMAHAFRVVAQEFSLIEANGGRPKLQWFDDFTKLLISIANKSGIKPSMQKHRTTAVRSGWIFEAALSLESFFPRGMRSPSEEACGKRLERSLKSIRKTSGQNPPRRK